MSKLKKIGAEVNIGYHYFCIKCDTKLFYNEPDAIYCEKCGNRLMVEGDRRTGSVLQFENK